RLGYLDRWAKGVLGDCTTDELVAVFDGLGPNIKSARVPTHSRISPGLLDGICPEIVSSLTRAVINEKTKTDEVDRFYRFLCLSLNRGSLSEQRISASVDEALESSGYSDVQLQLMGRN